MVCLNYRVVLHCCGLWLIYFVSLVQSHGATPLLLLISFDGFRWDYLNIAKEQGYSTPNFNQLINNGVVIGNGGLKNTFVTKTFPNHYTLATGLYEENHGVVANIFYDPDFNETFVINDVRNEEQKWWDGKSSDSGRSVEPIWITNDRKGGHRASGSYFWPGSIVDNQRPTYTRCYSNNASFTIGVDTMIEWFMDKTRPINLGLLYFSEPDHVGHQTGAASTAVMEKIVMLDGILGRLLKGLKDHDLLDRMNIIVTSDHGMTNTTEVIDIDIDPSLFSFYGSSPVWNILPAPGKEDEVYEKLKKIPRLMVYKKKDIPEDFHYQHNRRIQPIVISAPEGANLCFNRTDPICGPKGNHGYNNSLPSMHPIFIAHGPAFRQNYTSPPFNNVDVYPLMCHILDLVPHPNDGDFSNVKHILVEDDDEEGGNISISMITFLCAVGMTAFVSGVCCIAACRSHRIYLRKNGQFMRRLNQDVMSLTEKGHGNKQPLLASEDEDFA